MTYLYAVLCGEPWCYKPWEVGRLTWYQINAILFAERDDKGRVVGVPAQMPPSYEDEEIKRHTQRGLPDWRARDLVAEEKRRLEEEDRILRERAMREMGGLTEGFD